jgi:hypothetical protein
MPSKWKAFKFIAKELVEKNNNEKKKGKSKCRRGLPDGLFSGQKSKCGLFGRIFEKENVLYILSIWNIFQPLGILYGYLVQLMVVLVHISHFGTLYHLKSGNPGAESIFKIENFLARRAPKIYASEKR